MMHWELKSATNSHPSEQMPCQPRASYNDKGHASGPSKDLPVTGDLSSLISVPTGCCCFASVAPFGAVLGRDAGGVVVVVELGKRLAAMSW